MKLNLALFLAGFMVVPGLNQAQTAPPPGVVATHSILGDWVRSVAGPGISVSVMVGPNEDAHTYQPTPDDVCLLANARVVIHSGANFEPWLPGLVTSSRTKAKIIDLSNMVSLRRVGGARGDVDPHYWNDVRNALASLPAIRMALVEAYPDREQEFSMGEKSASAQLEELEKWVRSSVQKLLPERRKLVTAHDSIGYWADAYGFRVVGSAFGSLTTEAADPSARQIKELVDAIRTEKVPAIFVENFGNPGLIARVARESGVYLAPPLYTDALGLPNGPAATYVGLIRHNTRTIVESLSR